MNNLAIFDLDHTLWPFQIKTHVEPPLKATDSMLEVEDQQGKRFGFYADVGDVLVAVRIGFHLQLSPMH